MFSLKALFRQTNTPQITMNILVVGLKKHKLNLTLDINSILHSIQDQLDEYCLEAQGQYGGNQSRICCKETSQI